MNANEVALEIARILLENEICYLAWQKETAARQQAQAAAAPTVGPQTLPTLEIPANDSAKR